MHELLRAFGLSRNQLIRWLAGLTLGTLGVAALGYFALFAVTDGSDRTEPAQWLMASTSMLTLVAATAAAVLAGRTVRVELSREEARRQDERRAAANLVAAWSGGTTIGLHAAGGAVSQVLQVMEVIAVVTNQGPMPIRDVEIVVSHWLKEPAGLMEISRRNEPIIKAGDTLNRSFTGPEIAPVDRALDLDRGVVVTVTFTDAANRRWKRDADWNLEEFPVRA